MTRRAQWSRCSSAARRFWSLLSHFHTLILRHYVPHLSSHPSLPALLLSLFYAAFTCHSFSHIRLLSISYPGFSSTLRDPLHHSYRRYHSYLCTMNPLSILNLSFNLRSALHFWISDPSFGTPLFYPFPCGLFASFLCTIHTQLRLLPLFVCCTSSTFLRLSLSFL